MSFPQSNTPENYFVNVSDNRSRSCTRTYQANQKCRKRKEKPQWSTTERAGGVLPGEALIKKALPEIRESTPCALHFSLSTLNTVQMSERARLGAIVVAAEARLVVFYSVQTQNDVASFRPAVVQREDQRPLATSNPTENRTLRRIIYRTTTTRRCQVF